MEKVIKVKALPHYHIEILFNTGEVRIFDMNPYLNKGIFQKLKNKQFFDLVYVDYDTVCWPGNLDIAPETLYDRSVSINNSSLES